MVTQEGLHIFLRALEPEDLEAIHAIENDTRLWYLGDTIAPFSKFAIRAYLANANKDIYETKQLRLAICDKKTKSLIGLVDLFDFDAYNMRAAVGVVIALTADRNNGYGSEAIQLLVAYAKSHLGLHQLYANVLQPNTASNKLFKKLGFELIGIKKDWRRKRPDLDGTHQADSGYEDELLYQKIL